MDRRGTVRRRVQERRGVFLIKIRQAIVVEGKYDKIRLSGLVDTVIVAVDGFRIYKDREQLELLRLLADRQGLVLLTDSDAAGFQIRHYLSSALDRDKVIHAYIPDIYGKERRKEHPGKEGKLGVEGMNDQILRQALERAGVVCESEEEHQLPARQITKTDLYLHGFSGGEDSRRRRQMLLKRLRLPERLSANGLLPVLNAAVTYEEYRALADSLNEPAGGKDREDE